MEVVQSCSKIFGIGNSQTLIIQCLRKKDLSFSFNEHSEFLLATGRITLTGCWNKGGEMDCNSVGNH